ncbi:DNA recombination protein RmuC [Odoribacter sp. OttesenSCG-928-L07]|nr:DNA recombination protein RmuC [Odoribacter sp. OttesenSCG-928-L07]MDL2238615.1 DNA recombination protein RmuC [Bacteroidales bacterium OttesenSCG-928-L14]MDL2240507.1 DNA recombination protein RmuC [Bacteroidales bacterium OttesenSCG-928-K22]
MTTILIIVLLIISIVTLTITLTKKSVVNTDEINEKLLRIDTTLSKLDSIIRDEFARNREENQKSFKDNREELNNSFKLLGDNLSRTVMDLSNTQKNQFDIFSKQLAELLKNFDEKTRILQEQLDKSSKDSRAEQKEQLKEVRETVENKLKTLQEDNSKKLDEMRKVVDEKLQETVEKRFNESFKMISERLEQVHKGLGEMQTLASGVGDLKKVLTNVKTRGSLGEIQLGAILEQIFSPEQYEKNAMVKEGSQERVEYAIKLPGRNMDDKSLLLPIDSKFPIEDYQRLLDSYDNLANINPKEMETIAVQFENSVKKCAKDIRNKYINPPTTTDFAIMFVPTEGLYAEILRRPGLVENLHRECKVTVVGPTNLAAFLNSLQMGFRTLAIEKRSSEVWEILGAVKTEFGNFGVILDKTKKKLQETVNVIDQAGVRSRAIERKLRTVQELPQDQAITLIGEAVEIEEDLVI